MTALTSEKRKVESPFSGDSVLFKILTYIILCLVDGLALIIIYALLFSGTIGLGIIIGIAMLMANVVILVPALYPLRWMVIGLVLVTLLVIYPMLYTIFTAFTNYGDGHLQTKQEIIQRFTTDQQFRYVPDDATTYEYTLFRREGTTSDYALWLVRTTDDGTVEAVFAPLNAPIETVATDSAEAPEIYNDYVAMSRIEFVQVAQEVQTLVFGSGEDTAAIRSSSEAARPLKNQYVYDVALDTLTDQKTNAVYIGNDTTGFFELEGSGEALTPGYRVNVGLNNFRRLIEDPQLRGPIISIFIWTVTFAFFSVFTTFWMGLFMALIMNEAKMPGKKIIRSLLIIPYAMPGVISIVIWRGLIDPNLGILPKTLYDVFGFVLNWPGDTTGTTARVMVILVNLWLGYPYMMLISSGALQAIPSDIYEAAAVDGAARMQRFWQITLPMLLVTMGPLLIASFVYNFNNYLIIEALTSGNPVIQDSIVPAGRTDILINYTYNAAFERSADYGYASAITIVIFAIVAFLTVIQYRYTRTWEETGSNV
jgi:arabinogalactan oligomer / maltooligosaccharide transport system permease protein